MDQKELERQQKVKEYIRTHERQYAGLDRHFRGWDGFGWFNQDPGSIAENMLQVNRFKVKEIGDLSNLETFVEGERYKLAPGSFSIEMVLGEGFGGMVFDFTHPEDIEEFLMKAELEHPQELIGREMNMYWIGTPKEPVGGDRVVGVDLTEHKISLSELIRRDQGK